MRRIAFCLFSLCLLLPLGCKKDDTTTPATGGAADTDADGAADSTDTDPADATEE
jgi:hypothetical protein